MVHGAIVQRIPNVSDPGRDSGSQLISHVKDAVHRVSLPAGRVSRNSAHKGITAGRDGSLSYRRFRTAECARRFASLLLSRGT